MSTESAYKVQLKNNRVNLKCPKCGTELEFFSNSSVYIIQKCYKCNSKFELIPESVGDSILEKDDFEERLRQLLLEIDIETSEYPDPDYAGAMIWNRYLRKQGVESVDYSDEMTKYMSELYAEKEKQEKEELNKLINKS